MRQILVVIDMQNDFINGSLGTREAEAIVDPVIRLIGQFESGKVFATRDTHHADYLSTQEGANLPVVHCVEGTPGWQIADRIALALKEKQAEIINKPTFGSVALAQKLRALAEAEEIEITLAGLCTDICVVSNAMLIKAFLPEVKLSAVASCCAGVTPQTHQAALETMKMCQITVI